MQLKQRHGIINFHHRSLVSRKDREALHKHKGMILWFTGFSGSGKSTIAHTVEERLYQRGCSTLVLDGDNVRTGLCADLGFSPADRSENMRRVGELARLFIDAGMIVLIALISPFRADRQRVRERVGAQDFLEIYCRCPIEVCEARDVKGLYRRARTGEVKEYTGISSPYEEPLTPALTLDTHLHSLDECVARVMALLFQRGVLDNAADIQEK